MQKMFSIALIAIVAATAQAGPVKIAKLGCELDIPADWKVSLMESMVSANAKAIDAQMVVTKGYGGLQSARSSWQSMLKVKRTLEDSNEKWSIEVEPDKAHVGMRSYAVLVGNATNSCMLNIHVHPDNNAIAEGMAKTMLMSK